MKSKVFGLFTAVVLVLLLGAVVSAQGNAPEAGWSDNFDSYATGSQMHGQGGWKGWFNDPAAGALTSDAQARSVPNSVAILGASDLVHEYSGYTTGTWYYTAWQYIPSGTTGETYFILLNQYDDAGVELNWSVQVNFNPGAGTVTNEGASGGTLPLITDQWVQIRVEIDLDADVQRFYYGGNLLYQGSWTDGMSGGGILNIAAVDLFANGASVVYYDDLSLTGQYAVALSPATQTQTGAPGETVTHTFTLVNLGAVPDSFELSVSNNVWPTTVISETPELAPGETFEVNVVVTIPANPAPEQVPIGSDTFVLTAVSEGDPSQEAQAEGTTVAEATAAVDLGPDQAGSGAPGSQVTYVFPVTNMGNFTDTFALTVTGGIWPAALSATATAPLAPGATENVNLTVDIPAGAAIGDSDTVTVTATSTLDPGVSDSATATTTAQIYRTFLPIVVKNY